MGFLLTLLAYLAGAGLIVGTLIGGAAVVLRSEPAPAPPQTQKAKAAPVPPRIANWLERQIPHPPTAASEPLAVVEEANDGASVAPKVTVRDVSPPPRKRAKQRRQRRDDVSVSAAAQRERPPARDYGREPWGRSSWDERHGD